MSTECTVYGCIVGRGIPQSPSIEDWNRFYYLNQAVIDTLPPKVNLKSDLLVAQSLFTVPTPDSDPGALHRSQMIHFGASFKNLYDDIWENWLNQFETLLSKLYWFDAYMHVNIEYHGIHSLTWEADIDSIRQNPLKPVQKWEFIGDRRSFSFGP